MAQQQQRGGSWFSKGTIVENMGPGHLVIRSTQGEGANERTVFISTIEPGGHKHIFRSDVYRNDSRENPVTAKVRLADYARAEPSQAQWVPLSRGVFENARVRVAGVENGDPLIVFEPFKGSEIGRLRVVVRIKKIWKKIRSVANPN